MTKLATLFSFNGRVSRAHFWGVFYLVTISYGLVPLVFMIIADVTDSSLLIEGVKGIDIFGLIGALLFIVGVVVLMATIVKRFHDRGKSGAWALLLFTGVGLLWIAIECGFLKGTVGPNKYGEDAVYRKNTTSSLENK